MLYRRQPPDHNQRGAPGGRREQHQIDGGIHLLEPWPHDDQRAQDADERSPSNAASRIFSPRNDAPPAASPKSGR